MAKAELEDLNGKVEEMEAVITQMLIPKDPNDAKNAILEIRAGAGGDEALHLCRRPVPNVQPLCRAHGLGSSR